MKSATFGLHPEIADALQNGHRRELTAIENDYGVELQIVSAPGLARTEERVEWVEREPGSEPVMPRENVVVRASDLTRAEAEEKAEAKEKAQAKALPVKQGKRKASEAVQVENRPAPRTTATPKTPPPPPPPPPPQGRRRGRNGRRRRRAAPPAERCRRRRGRLRQRR